jgi:hypothetical protein
MTGCYTVCASRGAVAQLVARLVRIEKVRGSIPLSSTPGQRPSPEIFLRVTGPSYSSKVQQQVTH